MAHQAAPFTIKDNLESIYEVFTLLRGNVTAGLAQLSGEIIYGEFFKRLMETDHPIDEDKKLFETEEEAYSYLNENAHLLEVLTEQRIKCMFVIGVSILAATIIFHREKAIYNFNKKA